MMAVPRRVSCLASPGLGELVCTLGFSSWEKNILNFQHNSDRDGNYSIFH